MDWMNLLFLLIFLLFNQGISMPQNDKKECSMEMWDYLPIPQYENGTKNGKVDVYGRMYCPRTDLLGGDLWSFCVKVLFFEDGRLVPLGGLEKKPLKVPCKGLYDGNPLLPPDFDYDSYRKSMDTQRKADYSTIKLIFATIFFFCVFLLFLTLSALFWAVTRHFYQVVPQNHGIQAVHVF